MNLLSIRNIDTLKVIGTIGDRETTLWRLGDNLYAVPEVGEKVTILGKQFMGLDPMNDFLPKWGYPNLKHFEVVAVTPIGAYVKKWKEGKKKPFSLKRFFGGRG